MNEQAINRVISDYAVENANYRITVANLNVRIEELEAELSTYKEDSEEEKGGEQDA